MRLLHAPQTQPRDTAQQLSLRVRVFLDRMDCKQPTLLRSASPGPVVLCVAADEVRTTMRSPMPKLSQNHFALDGLMLMQP